MAGQQTTAVPVSAQVPEVQGVEKQPQQNHQGNNNQRPPYSRPQQNGDNYGHPCKGYFNYIVGQLCMNPNFFFHDEETPFTDDSIYIEIDKIMKAAQVICDKTMAHNRNRLEQNKKAT